MIKKELEYIEKVKKYNTIISKIPDSYIKVANSINKVHYQKQLLEIQKAEKLCKQYNLPPELKEIIIAYNSIGSSSALSKVERLVKIIENSPRFQEVIKTINETKLSEKLSVEMSSRVENYLKKTDKTVLKTVIENLSENKEITEVADTISEEINATKEFQPVNSYTIRIVLLIAILVSFSTGSSTLDLKEALINSISFFKELHDECEEITLFINIMYFVIKYI